MKLRFASPHFSYQLLRTASYTVYQAADLGECLATADRIPEGDMEAWHREWLRTARGADTFADEALQQNHHVSARHAFLRASNYYRAAELFLLPDDTRRPGTFESSRKSFQRAAEFFDTSISAVEIPYEGTRLSAHFYTPTRRRERDETGERRPVVLLLGDWGATLEELYGLGAAAAVRHGYCCLAVSGPGQGDALRVQHLPARVDYEVPVRAALDWVASRSEIDVNRITVMGVGFGSYGAARAAAFEPRVKALVAHGAVYDLWSVISRHSGIAAALDTLHSPAAIVNAASNMAGMLNAEAGWMVAQANWMLGTKTSAELMSVIRSFTLSNVASKIACPTFIMHGDDDHLVPATQAQQLYEAVQAPKQLRMISDGGVSPEHCQVGSLGPAHDIIFDWLDETFAAGRGR